MTRDSLGDNETRHKIVVGVLALQGCVGPHIRIIESLGHSAIAVRSIDDLHSTTHLIMPGGESTTMLKLLTWSGLIAPICNYALSNPIWGICAGSILMAKRVSHPEQESLNLMDIHAIRNFYGSQCESFEAGINLTIGHYPTARPIKAQFIRAPSLSPLTSDVEILAKVDQQPVLLKQGHLIACSFHSELLNETELHRFFINLTPKINQSDSTKQR